MKENIDVLVVGIEGYGYYSDAEAGGYAAIPIKILEKYNVDLDKFEFEFYVGEVDGKHSETECDVTKNIICVNEYLQGYEIPSSAQDFSWAILEKILREIILQEPNKYYDNKDYKKVKEFNDALIEFMEDKRPEILQEIKLKRELKQELADKLKAAIEDYLAFFNL